MFWNKKDNGDEGELPELPPLKPEFMSISEQEDDDTEEAEKHPLPSFPDSPTAKGFSQAAIKDAIETTEQDEETEQLTQELEPPSSFSYQPKHSLAHEPKANIFVKIEKFNSARKALASAQQKISEIDKMLKKIREARLREEQELSSWEKEVESAKARIEEASKDLFDKLS